MKTSTILAFAIAAAGHASAICPGYNYGIGNQHPLDNGLSAWTVYDDSCNPVDGLQTSGNPCTQGIFTCSGDPILFTGYHSSVTGLEYACRQDPNSGSCGSDVISVCCRNDGN
ncbi:unnamed protein product [Peniophora sp. CBMAI 1063]|nr:unnamed protein product [Peniophora sp. CBMAI 1063]